MSPKCWKVFFLVVRFQLQQLHGEWTQLPLASEIPWTEESRVQLSPPSGNHVEQIYLTLWLADYYWLVLVLVLFFLAGHIFFNMCRQMARKKNQLKWKRLISLKKKIYCMFSRKTFWKFVISLLRQMVPFLTTCPSLAAWITCSDSSVTIVQYDAYQILNIALCSPEGHKKIGRKKRDFHLRPINANKLFV